MNWWLQAIGFAAVLFSIIQFIPQIITTVRTKSTEGLSLDLIWFALTAASLWLVYGIGLMNLPLIVQNSVSVSIVSVLLYFYYKYDTPRYSRNKPQLTII